MKKFLVLTLLLVICLIVFGSCVSKEYDNETITVTFNANGGSNVDTQTLTKGSKIKKPTNPEKEGYTFDGWYVDDEKWSFIDHTVTDDITLGAKWSLKTYSITYVGAESEKITYTTEEEIILDASAPKYYELLGFYEDEAKSKPITKIEKGSTGNKTIYADTKYIGVSLEQKDDGTYEVLDCDHQAINIIIPSTYNGKPVTSIRFSAFGYLSLLEAVIIPNSITSIGPFAFSDCPLLDNIIIPDSVKTIEEYAFSNCTSLKSIVIPDNVTSLGESVFSGCTSLESVVVGNGVTSLNRSLFNECTSLKNVTVGNKVNSIQFGAFYSCTSLETIIIPKNVVSIDEFVFSNCTKLKTINCETNSRPINWNENCFALCEAQIVFGYVAG